MTPPSDWRRVAGPVTLHRVDGRREVCACLADAVRRLGWPTVRAMRDTGSPHGDRDARIRPWLHGYPSFAILRDEHGLQIPVWRIVEEASSVGLEADWNCWRPAWAKVDAYVFREGPVARTGRRRSRMCNWIRGPRTRQEMAAAACVDVDEECDEVGIVPRRGVRSLPTAWDDIARDVSRSWKRHRRHQWKV